MSQVLSMIGELWLVFVWKVADSAEVCWLAKAVLI